MIKYAMNEVYVDMKVEIWSDFVSPLCYIAKRKFDLALERFAQRQYVKVEYKSFLLHTNDRVTASTYQELLMETCNVPVSQLDDWIEQINNQAKELNLPLVLDGFAPTNTLDAHRLVKFAATVGKEVEVIDLLFKHFFSLQDKTEDNINEKNVLVQIACQCGLNDIEVKDFLSIKKYRRAVEVDEDDALEIGIENVPFFIFNEKYALVGNQPIEVFLEALEASWAEDKERLLKKQTDTPCVTSYCEGEDCDV